MMGGEKNCGSAVSKTTIETATSEAYNIEQESKQVFYVKNAHGDIIGKVDAQGNLLSSYAYNAFGELVTAVEFTPEQCQSINRFLYAGEQYDETSGLYYLRARNYDADAGRFTQEDTYLGDGRNLYAYVHSNPLKYVDPSGHMAETQIDNDGDTNDWLNKATDGTAGGLYAAPDFGVGEYLAGKAPLQVTPGTHYLEGVYMNDLNIVQPWEAHYDQYGRLIARTDYNAGNVAQGIPDTHYHLYKWGPGMSPYAIANHIEGVYMP